MPCAFITPITISIIPAITSQLTLLNYREARLTEESAARITGLVSMPCAVGLAVLAGPVTALLGGYRGDNLVLAATLMRILSITIVFNAVVLVTTAIMQAHGHAVRPVINMFIGGLLKLLAVYILTGNPEIGIAGAPIGSLLCYMMISILNLVSMRSALKEVPAIAKNLSRSALAALAMGAVVWVSMFALEHLGIGSGIMAQLILCGVPIVIGVVVYVPAVVVFKAITRSDCLLLPKGEKIAKLLHL